VATLNRARRARENAGLSVGQAARLLGTSADQLRSVEASDDRYAEADLPRIADLYGVSVDWMSGRVPLLDYAAVRRIAGADELPFYDRDVIAEVLASRPSRRKV